MSWKKISEHTGLSENRLCEGRSAGVFGDDIKSPKHTTPTKEQISDVKKHLGQGMNWNETAHLTGIPRSTLPRKSAERFFGSEHRDLEKRPRWTPLSQDQISQVTEALDKGNQSLTEIARLTGTTRRIIKRRKYAGVLGSQYRDLETCKAEE
jgi:DNA invertase Pin-like site-specific DNA recombinase